MPSNQSQIIRPDRLLSDDCHSTNSPVNSSYPVIMDDSTQIFNDLNDFPVSRPVVNPIRWLQRQNELPVFQHLIICSCFMVELQLIFCEKCVCKVFVLFFQVLNVNRQTAVMIRMITVTLSEEMCTNTMKLKQSIHHQIQETKQICIQRHFIYCSYFVET